jgi:hypothetical protein
LEGNFLYSTLIKGHLLADVKKYTCSGKGPRMERKNPEKQAHSSESGRKTGII